MSKRRVGVFGGTFDPVHLGHTTLARSAYQQCRFDELIVIPCALPPHRDLAQASNQQRLDMLEIAFSGFDNLSISDYEMRKSSVSYTVETLEYLVSSRLNTQWFFCLGGDSLGQFTTWHRWRDILKMAHLVVMGRETASIDELPMDLFHRIVGSQEFDPQSGATAGDIILLDEDESPISATAIRHLFSVSGQTSHNVPELVTMPTTQGLSELLDPRVLGYLFENKVYQ